LNEEKISFNFIISEGRHSVVISFPRLKLALKVFKPDLVNNAVKEYEFLKELSRKGYNVPKPYSLIIDEYPIIVREYIPGMHFKEFLNKADHEEIETVIMKLIKFIHRLDLESIFIDELSYPTKNIIVTDELDVYIIDFERATRTRSRSNVTQFLSFVYRVSMSTGPLKKKFEEIFDFSKIREVSTMYKKTKNLSFILKIFKRELKSIWEDFE